MFCSVKAQVLWAFVLLLYAQRSQADNVIDKLRNDAYKQIEKQLTAFIQKHDAMQQRITKFLRFSHKEFQQEACYNSTIETFIIENDNDPYGNGELKDIQHYFKFLMETGQQTETSDKPEPQPCKCNQIDEVIQQSMSSFGNKLMNLSEKLNTKLMTYTNLTDLIKTQGTEQNNLIIQTGQQLSEKLNTQIEMQNKSSQEANNKFQTNINTHYEQLYNSLTKNQGTSDEIKNKLNDYIETFTTSQNEQTKLLKSGLPNSCSAAIRSGNGAGAYQILISNKATSVYCDQHGRMMIQHQMEGPDDFFNRDWSQYKSGFGDPKSQYWLGLENVHLLTTSRRYELHMDMVDFDNITTQFIYNHFQIAGESDMYRLNKLGEFLGNRTENKFGYHINLPFSTRDRKNVTFPEYEACAIAFKSGWWYKNCHWVNFNLKVQTYKNPPLKEASMYIKVH